MFVRYICITTTYPEFVDQFTLHYFHVLCCQIIVNSLQQSKGQIAHVKLQAFCSFFSIWFKKFLFKYRRIQEVFLAVGDDGNAVCLDVQYRSDDEKIFRLPCQCQTEP